MMIKLDDKKKKLKKENKKAQRERERKKAKIKVLNFKYVLNCCILSKQK